MSEDGQNKQSNGIGNKIKGMISNFISDSKRIFIVSKKPTWDEFKRMSLIVALGMVLIGVIGFIVYLIFALTAIGY